MRVVFPCIGSENIGVCCLSGMLKAHGIETLLAFEPSLFDDTKFLHIPAIPRLFGYNERFAEYVASLQPRVLAFSVLTINYLWALDIARRVKERIEVVTVFGGVQVQALPKRVLANPQVDFVILGEGEYALLELVQSLEAGAVDLSISNLGYRQGDEMVFNPVRRLIEDLDTLPFADRALFADVEDYGTSMLYLCGRGCPFRCSFCSTDVIRSQYPDPCNYVRFQSVERCMAELKQLKKAYNPRSFLFQDDVFLINKGWLREFCDRYRQEIGVPFQTTGYPGVVTEEDIRLLRNAGCDSIEIGVQSFNSGNRRGILNRNESDRDVADCVEWCRKYGMGISIDYIFFPWEDNEADQLRAARFFLRYPPTRIANFYLSYLPSTAIVRYAIENGYLAESELEGVETGENAHYHAGGTFLADRKRLRFFNHFYNFFILIIILPRKWGEALFRVKAYRYTGFIPRIPLLLIKEAILPCLTGRFQETPLFTKYMRYYFRNLKTMLFGRYG